MSALSVTFVSSFTCPRRKLEKCSQMSTNVLMDPAIGVCTRYIQWNKQQLRWMDRIYRNHCSDESNGQRLQRADQHLHNSFKEHIPNRLLQHAHRISRRERLTKHWGWNCKALPLKEFWGHANNTHQHFPLANSVLPWWHLQYLSGLKGWEQERRMSAIQLWWNVWTIGQ